MSEYRPSDDELNAYVDGALDEAAMNRVEDYLRRHPGAAARVRAYLRQSETLQAAAETVPADRPPHLERLAERLAQRLQYRGITYWRQAAVLLLAFFMGWFGHVGLLSLLSGPAYTEEIVQAHLLTSADPGELPPISPERMKRLFARIGEAPHLPNLHQLGFEPVGAQLLPSDEGAVLHVTYRSKSGSTVSYFLFHSPEEDEVPRHVLHRNGVTMIYWQHEHSRYALAAPLSDEELTRIASFVESAPDIY